MKIINPITILLIFTLLLATCQGQDPPTANFEGAFDSLQPFPDQGDQNSEEYVEEENASEQQIEDEYGEEEEDILQFSQNLGDFIPDETFTFKLKVQGEEQFLIWPRPSVQSVRGMFHCQVDWSEDEDYEAGGYVDLTIMDGSTVVRQFKQQRLGVFKQPYSSKDHRFRFIFRSNDAPVEVYFSYECSAPQKKGLKQDGNTSQLAKVANSFGRVSRLLLQQEHEMERLMEMGSRHTSHLEFHLNSLWWRAVIEALTLLGSALGSLWMLKRQIYQGYQSLV